MGKERAHANRREGQISPDRDRSRLRVPRLLLGVIVYAGTAQVAYRDIVSPLNAYQGFTYREPDAAAYILSIAFATLVASLLPRRIEHVSHFIIWILFVFAAAPVIIMGQFIDVISVWHSSVLGLNVGACLLLARFLSEARPLMHLNLAGRDLSRYVLAVLVSYTLALVGYLFFSDALSLDYLGLRDVYDVRSEFRSAFGSNVIVGYLLPIQYYAVGPVIIALGLWGRRPSLTIFGIVAQLVIYSSTGNKTIVFSILGIAWLRWLTNHRNEIRGSSILTALVATNLALYLADRLLGSSSFTEVFVRRFTAVPGVLSQAYYEIFSNSTHTHFAEVLKATDENARDAPSLIVGERFFGTDANADASLWMHGFASYGYLGMYLVTLLLVILLWLADDCTRGIPIFWACALFLMPALAVSEASIFVAMLTHGFLAALVLSILLPRPPLESGSRETSPHEPDCPRPTRATL